MFVSSRRVAGEDQTQLIWLTVLLVKPVEMLDPKEFSLGVTQGVDYAQKKSFGQRELAA